ncbi:uncharacterized protein LOC130686969 [Daphnia carinata]|uniref:uncharacterized protein LOC130686969 n=1 Tax=Daphnia carinata TaxID=120202 RepID=UPI00257BC760|nr:uncharacterized protein LOC130686969 [Daphnia carinata]
MRIRLLSISARKSVVKFRVSMTTLAFLLSIGWSVCAENPPVMYLHFIRNLAQTEQVATCVGPFHIWKQLNTDCGYRYRNVTHCIGCYPYGCSQLHRSTNVTKDLNVGKGSITLEKVLGANETLYLDLEVFSCSVIDRYYLRKYANACNANPICQYIREIKPYAASTYRSTWPTTPIAGPPNVSYSPPKVELPGHENNSAINLNEGSLNQEYNYLIIWFSLAAAAVVFILVGCAILFTQRSKIMKCLGSKNNQDILDNAFFYRDMSLSRRQNQVPPQNDLYENIIPVVYNKETIYAELDLAPNNVNQEGEAAGRSFPARQSHGIVNQENSVIYAELQKY